jgi:hypothetical protein
MAGGTRSAPHLALTSTHAQPRLWSSAGSVKPHVALPLVPCVFSPVLAIQIGKVHDLTGFRTSHCFANAMVDVNNLFLLISLACAEGDGRRRRKTKDGGRPTTSGYCLLITDHLCIDSRPRSWRPATARSPRTRRRMVMLDYDTPWELSAKVEPAQCFPGSSRSVAGEIWQGPPTCPAGGT